jgi:hypothetical protein
MFEIDTSKLKKIIFSRIFTQTTILKIFLIFIYLCVYSNKEPTNKFTNITSKYLHWIITRTSQLPMSCVAFLLIRKKIKNNNA